MDQEKLEVVGKNIITVIQSESYNLILDYGRLNDIQREQLIKRIDSLLDLLVKLKSAM